MVLIIFEDSVVLLDFKFSLVVHSYSSLEYLDCADCFRDGSGQTNNRHGSLFPPPLKFVCILLDCFVLDDEILIVFEVGPVPGEDAS